MVESVNVTRTCTLLKLALEKFILYAFTMRNEVLLVHLGCCLKLLLRYVAEAVDRAVGPSCTISDVPLAHVSSLCLLLGVTSIDVHLNSFS